jgi:alkylation response protein AidB-like acyl-CoA dehydrogenase
LQFEGRTVNVEGRKVFATGEIRHAGEVTAEAEGVFIDVPTTKFVALADQHMPRFAKRAAHYDRENEFPFENFEELHKSGYLALTVPEEYGGSGADPLELAMAQERLAHGCGSTALAATMHLSLLGRQGEIRSWPEETYARICRDVVERGALINNVNSEPDLGSPSRGALPSSTAIRTPTGWRINGHKRWASLSVALSYLCVLAAADDGIEPPHRATFLVPANAPGIRIEETWDNLGMRATASNDFIFENVDVPFDALLPGEVSGLPSGGLGWWTFPSAAVYLGIAGAARDFAVDYAKNRKPNGMTTSIAELPNIQRLIAEIELLLLQAHSVLYETAEAWIRDPDGRDDLADRLAAIKYLSTNYAIQVTDLAMRVAGSTGLSRSNPLERYFRDVRTGLGHPPMDDAALATIGKSALGLLSRDPMPPPGTSSPAPVPITAGAGRPF